MEVSVHFG